MKTTTNTPHTHTHVRTHAWAHTLTVFQHVQCLPPLCCWHESVSRRDGGVRCIGLSPLLLFPPLTLPLLQTETQRHTRTIVTRGNMARQWKHGMGMGYKVRYACMNVLSKNGQKRMRAEVNKTIFLYVHNVPMYISHTPTLVLTTPIIHSHTSTSTLALTTPIIHSHTPTRTHSNHTLTQLPTPTTDSTPLTILALFLHMYVCMYVCLHTHTYTQIHIQMYFHTNHSLFWHCSSLVLSELLLLPVLEGDKVLH